MRSRSHPHQRRHPHAAKKSNKEINLIGAQEQDSGKGPGHINFTLGKVDQAQNTIDHSIAQGDQGIDAAGSEAVENLLQEHPVNSRAQVGLWKRCSAVSTNPAPTIF